MQTSARVLCFQGSRCFSNLSPLSRWKAWRKKSHEKAICSGFSLVFFVMSYCTTPPLSTLSRYLAFSNFFSSRLSQVLSRAASVQSIDISTFVSNFWTPPRPPFFVCFTHEVSIFPSTSPHPLSPWACCLAFVSVTDSSSSTLPEGALLSWQRQMNVPAHNLPLFIPLAFSHYWQKKRKRKRKKSCWQWMVKGSAFVTVGLCWQCFCPRTISATASRWRRVPFPTALIFHHVLLDLVLYRSPAIRSPELSKGLFRISVCVPV